MKFLLGSVLAFGVSASTVVTQDAETPAKTDAQKQDSEVEFALDLPVEQQLAPNFDRNDPQMLLELKKIYNKPRGYLRHAPAGGYKGGFSGGYPGHGGFGGGAGSPHGYQRHAPAGGYRGGSPHGNYNAGGYQGGGGFGASFGGGFGGGAGMPSKLSGRMQQLFFAIVDQFRRRFVRTGSNHGGGVTVGMAARYAFHAAGTYNHNAHGCLGGSNGGRLALCPEKAFEENRGTSYVREQYVVPVARIFPGVSPADLSIIGGFAAYIHATHGHRAFLDNIRFQFGRRMARDPVGPNRPCPKGKAPKESQGAEVCDTSGRLPGDLMDKKELRAYYEGNLGLTPREAVALQGSHSIGWSHQGVSGYPEMGWTDTPDRLDTDYFRNMLHTARALRRGARLLVGYAKDKRRYVVRGRHGRPWFMFLSDVATVESYRGDDSGREYWKAAHEFAFRPAGVFLSEFARAVSKVYNLGVGH